MKKTIKLVCITVFALLAASSRAGVPAQVPATGETFGSVVGSRSGVAWPNPRFIVGSGVTANCITDRLTGLMWARNASIGFTATSNGTPRSQPDYANTNKALNALNWSNSFIAIAKMNSATTKLCGYSDWRLPNKVEFKSIINYGSSDKITWLNSQGFINIVPRYYWTASAYMLQPDVSVWIANFFPDDSNYYDMKNNLSNIWPVRGGQ